MSRTPEMVKKRPIQWEQDLLTSARIAGGQKAVDAMAVRLAEYDKNVKARAEEARTASFDRARLLARDTEEEFRSLMQGDRLWSVG